MLNSYMLLESKPHSNVLNINPTGSTIKNLFIFLNNTKYSPHKPKIRKNFINFMLNQVVKQEISHMMDS